MNSRQFNGIFRPLVKSAWEMYCVKWGISPNKKDAYRLWYEQHLSDATRGRIRTTKDATSAECRHIIDYFTALISHAGKIQFKCWQEAQVNCFSNLAKTAHRTMQIDGYTADFETFVTEILTRHHITNINGVWIPPNKTESFDKIMADLAVTANDEYWLRRTAAASETRMRYQIERFLIDLDYLDKRFVHTWSYIKGIYKQSETLPADIDDCPAQTLWRILQMLDTHIRRMCKDFGVRPMDLPTRAHPHPHVKISEQASHLHIGHELEHCPAVEVHTADDDADTIPF